MRSMCRVLFKKKRLQFPVVHWKQASGMADEVTKMRFKRKVDTCCVQDSWWMGEGTQMLWKGNVKYKFFWQGYVDSKAQCGMI